MQKDKQEVVIVAAKRTAIGSFLGSLKEISAKDLAISVANAILKETNIDTNQIDSLILGQVLQSGQGQNVGRQVAIGAGLRTTTNAFVVNQICGSGLRAVQIAYEGIALQSSSMAIAGGTENMSRCPFGMQNLRQGHRMGDDSIIDLMIKDGLWCAIENYHMGITAENLAAEYGISRAEQDNFALNSQLKASKASIDGAFHNEIIPIPIKTKKGEVIFEKDEFIRHDASLDALARLKPAFKEDGSVTAGNSSGVNDGAALLLLTSRAKAKELGLRILARFRGFGGVGVEPRIMGIGAAFAAKKALENTGLKLEDIDLIEANEAFSAQSITTLKELGLPVDSQKVNVKGGAIALGHPIGASGARILTTLVHSLRERGKNLGLATLCVGGGQGISSIIEITE